MEKNEYLNDKYLELFKKRCTSGDIEINHSEADDILCDLLNDLGYTELVNEFKKLKNGTHNIINTCYNFGKL